MITYTDREAAILSSLAFAIKDLSKANIEIKKRHRYACGVEGVAKIDKERPIVRMFFSSPDDQRSELYYELRKLGYVEHRYEASYFWAVIKNGTIISYTEGDIAIM